jgi:hypothetical protein
MGIIIEEIKNYDPYTDKFIKNTTTSRIEIGPDGSVHNLSLSNSYGLYAKNQEELDKCDYIDKSTKLYTKDEVIAMLTELQLEIKELKSYESADGQDLVMLADIGTLFQQKINNLKED